MKQHKLPRGLRAALTVLVILVLSVALTQWRQNGSTWATGQWDDASQALVFGRMLQMQQKQSAPGGFMGVYTEEWGDVQNKYLYRENTPVEPEQYQSYTHQTGLQGWGFAVLNKVLSVWQEEGEARERALYTLNSILYYAITLCLCLVAWRAVGAVPALGWLAAALLAPWVQRGMKDLYWCLWLWWLPMLAGIWLCAVIRRRGQTPWWACVPLFAAVFVRCLCGFEFISVYLILSELPLVWCWAEDLAARRPARPWLGRMTAAGVAGVGGVAAALGAWLVQGVFYYGNWQDSLNNVLGAVATRVSVSDNTVREVTVGQVVTKYLTDPDPVLQLGTVGIPVAVLIGATAAVLLLTAALLAWRDRAALRQLLPLVCVWGLSLAAPLSWMVLSKAHADIHVQLIPMLWHFALVPVSCLVIGACLTRVALCSGRRGV